MTIDLVGISLNHLVQMNSIECIEYVIKYSYSMDSAIKRQCCHTLVTFVTLCCVDIQSLRYLIVLNIIKTMTELLMDYKYLEKSEIISLIHAFLMLLEKSEFDSRIGEYIEEEIAVFETILFDSATPTKICKKIQWLLTTYFEL